jgi:hypothetical protein
MSNISDRLNKVLGTLNDSNLSKVAYDKFRQVTPIKTGHAKRNTNLSGKTIDANYSYANVLDKGRHMTSRGMRGSKQAPRGMTEPTIDHLRQYIQQRLGVAVRRG